jgi:hypothetical protein
MTGPGALWLQSFHYHLLSSGFAQMIAPHEQKFVTAAVVARSSHFESAKKRFANER